MAAQLGTGYEGARIGDRGTDMDTDTTVLSRTEGWRWIVAVEDGHGCGEREAHPWPYQKQAVMATREG